MDRLIRMAVRRPWLVILAFLSVLSASGMGISQLVHEDDVLAFLPEDDPDVQAFREISDRFGSLRIALVGISARSGDVLDAEHLTAITRASTRLAQAQGVSRVTSLTTVTDVAFGAGGVVVERLIPRIPTSEAEHEQLQTRVLSRDLIVGQLISPDARAAALLVYFGAGASTTQIVEQVRAVAQNDLRDFDVFLTGAPFAAESIYGQARIDVTRLSPIAAAVLILVILLSFRDVVGLLLTFATVGIGVLTTLGLMGWLGERYTVLTSTLPILLLATGSSYAVHVLGRYYIERETSAPDEALRRCGSIVARPVAIAAWTTIAAFASFLVMDVRPMKAFGIEVAFGTLACWITSLTLVPAVLTLVPRAPAREQLLPFGGALWWVWQRIQRHRRATLALLATLSVAAAFPMMDVEVKTDAQAFLRQDSPTWRANQFFDTTFGGSRFVQVEVEGDFSQPSHIRELARLVDRIRAISGVTQVASLVEPLELTTDLLGGGRRLPSTPAQADKAYLFLDGEDDFAPLLRPDHRHALIHVRVRGDAEPVTVAINHYLDHDFRGFPQQEGERDAIERVHWLAQSRGVEIGPELMSRAICQVSAPLTTWTPQRLTALDRVIAGEDFEDLEPSAREALAQAIREGNDPAAALVVGGQTADDAAFYAELFARSWADAQRQARIDSAVATILQAFGPDPSLRAHLTSILTDLVLTDITPAKGTLYARVTGEPVLDQALSRCVARNQVRTMFAGLLVVAVLLVILFKRISLAAICILPAIVTAVLIGGVMGLAGVRIDLSTAMCGAILTDTASDFGMHYLWYLRQDRPDQVVRTIGPVLIVSNLLVSLGFFAFALGQSPVMHLFGALSGSTCVVSALVGMVLVPALWRNHYVAKPIAPRSGR